MRDYFEMREDVCEEWYFRNVKDGVATCYCGKTFKLEDGQQGSADPYGIPICPDCFDEICHQSVMDHIHGEIDRANQAHQIDPANPSETPLSNGDV